MELDRLETEPCEQTRNTSEASNTSEDERILNDTLRTAVYAYSFSWLPLRSAFQKTRHVDEDTARRMEQDVRDHLWRRARVSMLPAMSRPSYRSVLALLLFAFAEMPVDNEDEGFSRLCNDVLFAHINHLKSPFQRQRARPLTEYTTAVPLTRGFIQSSLSKRRDQMDDNQEHMRDSICWLGIIVDSTRSLLTQRPSVILPGRSGDTNVWYLIRQRTVIFDQSFRRLHGSPLPLPPDIAIIVLQHASACKTMYIGMLNQFFDAVYHSGESIDEAAQRIVTESSRFHDVFDQLLAMCARDYLSMKVESQLHYCESRNFEN